MNTLRCPNCGARLDESELIHGLCPHCCAVIVGEHKDAREGRE